MKTLLIHAEDSTTDFLSTIYDGKDWTIVKKNIGKSKLKSLIKEHDIIVVSKNIKYLICLKYLHQ